jgi:hypothetical protein
VPLSPSHEPRRVSGSRLPSPPPRASSRVRTPLCDEPIPLLPDPASPPRLPSSGHYAPCRRVATRQVCASLAMSALINPTYQAASGRCNFRTILHTSTYPAKPGRSLPCLPPSTRLASSRHRSACLYNPTSLASATARRSVPSRQPHPRLIGPSHSTPTYRTHPGRATSKQTSSHQPDSPILARSVLGFAALIAPTIHSSASHLLPHQPDSPELIDPQPHHAALSNSTGHIGTSRNEPAQPDYPGQPATCPDRTCQPDCAGLAIASQAISTYQPRPPRHWPCLRRLGKELRERIGNV